MRTPLHMQMVGLLAVQVHTPEYVAAFNQGRLDAAACRRIGFGACMAAPKLIERTKAEVAGQCPWLCF